MKKIITLFVQCIVSFKKGNILLLQQSQERELRFLIMHEQGARDVLTGQSATASDDETLASDPCLSWCDTQGVAVDLLECKNDHVPVVKIVPPEQQSQTLTALITQRFPCDTTLWVLV